MSNTHRSFMIASIVIALGAALVSWAAMAPKKYEEPEQISQIFYMPPDVQPNCVNEFGCDRKTRLPDWLNKHLGIEEKEAAASQQEFNQQTGNAAVVSVFYGLMVGIFLYGILAGSKFVFRTYIKPRLKINTQAAA